jgi:NCS1 family nucleobase:cation symporter-1
MYWYTGGFNPRALIALAAGIAPCAPGFIGTVTTIPVAQVWMDLYTYAWFISFAVGGAAYLLLSTILPPRRIADFS